MTTNIKFLEKQFKRFKLRNKADNNAGKLYIIAYYLLYDRELVEALNGFITLQNYNNFEGLENIKNKIKENIIASVKKEAKNFDEIINWINN